MRRTRPWLLIVLCALLIAVLAAGAYVAWLLLHAEEPVPGEPIGYLTEADGVLLDGRGRRVQLADWRGQPVALMFWSSWCSDCEQYMTNGFAKVREAAEKQGVRFVLVCREGVRNDSRAKADKALKELRLDVDTMMDPQAALYGRMGLHGVPSLVLLDAEGRLVYRTEDMPDAVRMEALAAYAVDPEAQTMAFIRRNLLNDDGAAASAYHAEGDAVLAGGDVLSESEGLLLQYAVRTDDQTLFDRVMDYVRRMTVNGLCSWRIRDGAASDVNASLDDLRILDALRQADERWGGYRSELVLRAAAYADHLAIDDIPRDYAALDGTETSADVTLCYLDAAALRGLGNADARFLTMAEKAEAILRGGIISAAFPLYFPKYDAADQCYFGTELHMSEAMVTVLHAAKAGIIETDTLDWLEKQLRSGAVYARYDLDGRVIPGYDYESTATYALIAQTAMHCGRSELASLAMEKMEQSRSFAGPMLGSYGSAADGTHFSFDVLEALLSWQAMR